MSIMRPHTRLITWGFGGLLLWLCPPVDAVEILHRAAKVVLPEPYGNAVYCTDPFINRVTFLLSLVVFFSQKYALDSRANSSDAKTANSGLYCRS